MAESATHELDGRTLLTTERARVRRWRPSEVAALLEVYGDADAMRWVDDGEPISREECERWLDVTAENYRRRDYGMFAVELNGREGVAGFCGLVHPGGQTLPEIKYAYQRDCWGRGLATEVVIALLDHARVTWGLDEIIASTAPENEASHRVLRKAGMRDGDLETHTDGSRTLWFRWQVAQERSP